MGGLTNLIMALAAWYTFYLTNMQALLLDGNFSFIASLSCIAAIVITKYSSRKSVTFPRGHFLLEPLYAVLKQLLIIVILAASTIKSITKIINYTSNVNMQAINVGPVLVYSITMVTLCFLLAFVYSRVNKKLGGTSIILTSESKSAYVDGIMSAGIGVAVASLNFLDTSSSWAFMAYIGDAVITLILVMITIRTPIRVLYEAFKELTNGVVTDEAVRLPIVTQIKVLLPKHIELKTCRIRKTGTAFHINASFSFSNSSVDVREIRSIRKNIEDKLKEKYTPISLNFIID